MSEHTASAAGGAMPAEGHKTRRALLRLFGAAPALAMLPALASSPSTTQLSALIEAHRAAYAVFSKATGALEAAEPDEDIRLSCLGRTVTIGSRDRRDLIQDAQVIFEHERIKLYTLRKLSPDLGEAACVRLETEKADYLAQIDEAFAGYLAAEGAYKDALDAEEAAILAICEHRCVLTEEIAIKVRYLAGLDCMLEPDQVNAFFASLLPEGEGLADA